MSETGDDKRRDEILRRMLKTPPQKRDGKEPSTKTDDNREGDGEPDTPRRPAVRKG